jgi:hypothetical protein
MAQPEPDTDTTPTAPPGLHAAADESRECGNCTFYRSSGACTKFPPLSVSDEWLCGAWKAGGRDVADVLPVAHSIREAQKVAIAHARAQKTKRQEPAQP